MRTLALVPWLFVLASCMGPKPKLESMKVYPPPHEGLPYRVEAVIRNESGGEGDVAVNLALKPAGKDLLYKRQSEVELSPHETAALTIEIYAPPGDYTPQAELHYPPN